MLLEYDGSAYHGWQRQAGHATVQQVVEEAIGRITAEKVTVFASGRTDAGVHALNQTAHFKTDSNIGASNLLAGINSLLPQDVVIRDLQEADASFHARFSVKSKVYMYQIFNGPVRPVLLRHYTWHVRRPLDVTKMEGALALIKGCHDFSAFCGKKAAGADCIRTILETRIERVNSEIMRIYLEADGFLRFMVRSIVGTAAEVGKGKREPETLWETLQSKERKHAGPTAPPQGLFLLDVKY